MTTKLHLRSKALLERYLEGNCSDTEKVLVEQWYDDLPSTMDIDSTVDPDILKKEFIGRFEMEYGTRRIPFSRRLLTFAAAASVVFCIAMVSGWLFRQSSIPQELTKLYSVSNGLGKIKKVMLPDSSIVWMNANTSLTWNNHYGEKIREVTLSGEAGFDVRKDEKHPFIVHSYHADVKVLGTFFNVESYPASDVTRVALVRGKVAVHGNRDRKLSGMLSPGEAAVFTAKGTLAIGKANVRQSLLWMQGGFYAEDALLKTAIERLCHQHGYEVIWKRNSGLEKHISVAFPPQGFESMLQSLCYLGRLHYTLKDRSITIL